MLLVFDICCCYCKGIIELLFLFIDIFNVLYFICYLFFVFVLYFILFVLFEKVVEYWVKGKVDLRWVVWLFEGLRGKMIGLEEEGEIFFGLVSIFMDMDLVDDLSK